MSKSTDKPKDRYRVLIGMNYLGKRAEPGAIRSDIPVQSIKWLLKRGAIEHMEDEDKD